MLRDYARTILLDGSLDAKLRAPTPADLIDDDPGAPEFVNEPARDARLTIASSGEVERLPALNQLGDPKARATCIARFAHHELQAIELFAWALLAFPAAPPALRRGLVGALAEEQQHCRLYLARLAAHGAQLGDEPLSGYFFRHIEKITSPLAFLCAQGLTLEQANLDFTMLYRDAFARAGDHETAQVLQRVHDDEIGHVKLALTWMRKLSDRDGADEDVATYRAHAPFPYSLARAKARRFEAGARRRAGMSDAMIEAVRAAKPYVTDAVEGGGRHPGPAGSDAVEGGRSSRPTDPR